MKKLPGGDILATVNSDGKNKIPAQSLESAGITLIGLH
jgi:hypothetical protein